MNRLAAAIAALSLFCLGACANVDRSSAAALGTAGENATQALSTQTASAANAVGDLGQWWAVHDSLVCVAAKDTNRLKARTICLNGVKSAVAPPANPILPKLVDALNKRKKAIDSLNQAYVAFVDLANYNAGQQATAALKTSFADVNSFVSAASALDPALKPIQPISTTIEDVVGGAVAIFADSNQNAQILAANNDLETANEKLYEGLNRESGAVTSLLGTLQAERVALYQAGLAAGLVAPNDVLTPVFAQAYPNIKLSNAPAANNDAVQVAAQMAIAAQAQSSVAAIPKTYTDALSALNAVAAQHKKLAEKQPLNLTEIESDISSLQTDIAQLNSSTTTAPATKPATK